MVVMTAQFGEQDFTLERFHALRQRSVICIPREFLFGQSGQCLVHFIGHNFFIAGKQQDALDDISQLAHVAGPRIVFQYFQRLG